MESAIDKVASLPLSDFNPRNKTIFFKCKVTIILPVKKGQKKINKKKEDGETRFELINVHPSQEKIFFSNGNYQNILLTKAVLIFSKYFSAKLVEGQNNNSLFII